mgnify:CR=1 FL=1
MIKVSDHALVRFLERSGSADFETVRTAIAAGLERGRAAAEQIGRDARAEADALIVEAAELQEHFQWLTPEQSVALAPEKRAAVADELRFDIPPTMIRLINLIGAGLWADAMKIKY